MCVPLKALFLVSIISNTEINIYFLVYKLKGGLPYNTDCFSYLKAQFRRAMLSCDSSCFDILDLANAISRKV